MGKISIALTVDASIWKRVEKALEGYVGVGVTEYVELALLKQVLSDERHQGKLSED